MKIFRFSLWTCLTIFTLDMKGVTALAGAVTILVTPPEQTIYCSVTQLPAIAPVSFDVDIGHSWNQPLGIYSLKATLFYSRNFEAKSQVLMDRPHAMLSLRQTLKLQLMSYNTFTLSVVATNQVFSFI